MFSVHCSFVITLVSKSYITSENKNSSNSYQHFQQAFQHLSTPDVSNFCRNFGDICRNRKRGFVTKKEQFFVYITQGNSADGNIVPQNISILEQVHNTGVRERNELIIGNDYMILKRYPKQTERAVQSAGKVIVLS